MKAALKAEREAARSTLKQTLNLTPAERVADFMKESAGGDRESHPRRGETNYHSEPEPPVIVASVGWRWRQAQRHRFHSPDRAFVKTYNCSRA